MALIDRIEHKGRQIRRWGKVILIFGVILYLSTTLIGMYITTNTARRDKELRATIDIPCLMEIGEQRCTEIGKNLKYYEIKTDMQFWGCSIYDNELRQYVKTQIDITDAQMEECAKE